MSDSLIDDNSSINSSGRLVLNTVDYIVIVTMLCISAGIGVYFRFAGGKQRTTHEFLMAGRDMAILPVAFSVMASGSSAITYLGIASEMYIFGTYYAFSNLGVSVGAFVAGYLFLPVLFKTGACTTYEYLQKRFGKTLRLICSISFSVQSMLYMGVILYAPALALSAVTQLSIWMSVVSVGVVCTFYCTLGGMKAVLWTDVFQATLMYGGLIAMVIKGCQDVGGASVVISRAMEGGRLIIPGFEIDIFTRYTFINVFLNGFFIALSAYGASQTQVQRLLTVRNVHRARCALFLNVPMTSLLYIVNCFAGLVVYANFYNCDPLSSDEKLITKPDQLLPYFSLTSLGQIPGLPGLCVCGVLSAALSTMSSIVNSLTTVTIEDFIRPAFSLKGMTETRATLLAKLITLAYGGMGLVLTFIVAKFGNVLQASTIVYGLVAGPTLGVFLLGVLTSKTNEKGAISGLVLSLILTAWISLGATSVNVTHPTLPVSTEGCPSSNISSLMNTSVIMMLTKHDDGNATKGDLLEIADLVTDLPNESNYKKYVFPLYKISYMWFTPIGVLTTVVFGYIFSFIFAKDADPDSNLLCPLLTKMGIIKGKEKIPDVELTSATSMDKNQDNHA